MEQKFLQDRLRKFLRGFEGINIQGFEEKLTSGGGAGGFDPCFQLFERAVGIKFEPGPFSKTQ